jgi:hypothetical protein
VADGTHPCGKKDDIYVAAVTILKRETGVCDTGRAINLDRKIPKPGHRGL